MAHSLYSKSGQGEAKSPILPIDNLQILDSSQYIQLNFPAFFPGMLFNVDHTVIENQKYATHPEEKPGDLPPEEEASPLGTHQNLEKNLFPVKSSVFSPTIGPEETLQKKIEEDLPLGLASQPFTPIEVYWENVSVEATVKEKKGPCRHLITKKLLIDQCSGVIRPGTFTAILGPSGCGKTTLLNFLSGRMASENLELVGIMKVNGHSVQNIDLISNLSAYVMQDDILLATFTPREAFNFIAGLRLNLSLNERKKHVEQLIKDLGLTECANTKVGNNFIRGISGGERKRTSIGVELLTNPSLIFLDEPTTGLDSATAYHVINILKNLAHSGRTVVSTIKQPSSEIYDLFDRLILMVQGRIVYQGDAAEALNYFSELGLKPAPFINPSTFFMKCLNPEGLLVEEMQKNNNYDIRLTAELKAEFKERVGKMLEHYHNSPEFKQIQSTTAMEMVKEDKEINTVSWLTQFKLILWRGFINEFRNPLELRTRYLVSVIFSFICCIVFTGLGDYQRGIQNRMGCLFFVVMGNVFSPIMHSILTFSAERPLFLREVLNRTYRVSSYFWGKTSSELPFHLTYPILQVLIIYWIIGLSEEPGDKVVVLMVISTIAFFTGVSYGLFFSVFFSKGEMAMALVPIFIIPFMLFGGFFVNQENIPYYFYPLKYISLFKYAFQAAVENEFRDTVFYCSAAKDKICDPVEDGNFGQNIWESCLILLALGIGLRILTFLAMRKISTPKRPVLKHPDWQIQKNKIVEN